MELGKEYFGPLFQFVSNPEITDIDFNGSEVWLTNTANERYLVDPGFVEEHLTPEERASRRKPEDWINSFQQGGISEAIARKFVMSSVRQHGAFPTNRLCAAVHRLRKLYPPSVIERGMARLNDAGTWKARILKSVCDKIELENRTAPGTQQNGETGSYETTRHENIRNDYE